MCGIAGKLIFNQAEKISTEEITVLTDTLKHRGPDGFGVYVKNQIGLGHRRLAILDLSEKGSQPMSDDSQKIWITFNGEIYNFQELREELKKQGEVFQSQTDTEVIIHLYKKYGQGCLQHLRGMFAFAIWDENKQELFLARDRVGKKPLKYYVDKKCFIFASELKSLLQDPAIKKEVDIEAISSYLALQYIPHPKTGFKNIYKLEPGHCLTVHSNGKIEKKEYWKLNYEINNNHSESKWTEKILNELKTAVRLRMISDVEIGAHLSGGIDSSLITALMAEQSNKPIKTFSIGFQEKTFNELRYAKLVAEKYHTEHHEFIVTPNALEILPQLIYQYEEPFGDSSAIPTWYLMAQTKNHVSVALNGDGGDENFGGYDRYLAYSLHKFLKLIPAKNLLKNFSFFSANALHSPMLKRVGRLLENFDKNPQNYYINLIEYFRPEERQKFFTNSNNSSEKSINAIFQDYNKVSGVNLLTAVDINSYLPGDLLVKVDMASMAFGLEIRSPFLDQKFLELSATMPENYKLRNGEKKYLLKKIARQYLPPECIDRPKQGFALPLEQWFRNELKTFVTERLLDSKFLELGFNKKMIENLLMDHFSEKRNNAGKIWVLLSLSEWYKTYFS